MMSGIRGKNTKPELLVRKALHARGFRYKPHDQRLPGKPDMSFPKHKAVIFVNGCFWHGHGCHLFKWPSTRPEFWQRKIIRNREKDEETRQALIEQGWRIAVIHECALKGRTRLDLEQVIDETADWLRTGYGNHVIEGRQIDNARGGQA